MATMTLIDLPFDVRRAIWKCYARTRISPSLSQGPVYPPVGDVALRTTCTTFRTDLSGPDARPIWGPYEITMVVPNESAAVWAQSRIATLGWFSGTVALYGCGLPPAGLLDLFYETWPSLRVCFPMLLDGRSAIVQWPFRNEMDEINRRCE